MTSLTPAAVERIAALADDVYLDNSIPDFVLMLAIANMADAERAELRALMWLGRGSAGESAAMWDDMVRDATAQSSANGADDDGDYIGGKTDLAAYLRNGLKKLIQADKPALPLGPTFGAAYLN